MRKILLLITAFSCMACLTANAHHSFAIYAIDNRIDMAGVLTKIEFRQPHIVLELEIINEDGSIDRWAIESMSPQRWDRMGISRNIVEVGELVTIEGWPARNGENALLLSAITTGRDRTLVIDRVRQPGARTGF
jgi:hypothetical protein